MIGVLTLRTGTSSIDSRDISSKLTQARGNRDLIRGLFLRCTIATDILVVRHTTPLSLALASLFEYQVLRRWRLGRVNLTICLCVALEYRDKCWSAIMCSVLGEDGGTCIFVGCVIQEKYRAETLSSILKF